MPPISEIQEKALAVFSRYGLKSVNMDDLAFHTGVSKKTFYQLFNSKEELVFSLFEFVKDDWIQAVDKIKKSNESPIYKLMAFYDLRYEYIVRFNPAFLLRSGKQYERIYFFMAEVRQQINELVSGFLIEAQQAGLLRSYIDIEIYISASEMLFDYFTEQCNPTAPGSDKLFKHLIFPSIAGIVDPDKYDIGKDLEKVFKHFPQQM